MNRDPSVAAAMLQEDKSSDSPSEEILSRASKARRKSRNKSTSADKRPGLEGDASATERKQDTPGRHKSASSRQQTQPRQKLQTGRAGQDGEDR